MSKIDHLTIELEPEIATSVAEAVAMGDYASSDDIIREALSTWRSDRLISREGSGELARLWREGRDSGDAVEATPVFDRLRAKYAGNGK